MGSSDEESDWEPSSQEESDDDYESPVKKKAAPKKPAAAKSKKAAAKSTTTTTTTTTTKKAAPKKPAAPKSKKTASKSKVLDSDDDNDVDDDYDDSVPLSEEENILESIAKSVRSGEKTLEQIYQKKELLDQILLRPDTYIGTIEKSEDELWVWENDRMVRRKISYVPGIYKIFDEILVNAADNNQRQPKMKAIKVDINAEKGSISVWNDGAGIPIEMHKEHKIYIPELIFGNLLTSSHYDDSERRLTGGRNGFGAKLANIFSTKFIVECADSERRKLYKQTFTNNMRNKEEPKITSYSKVSDYTCITFFPELSRFGMTHFDEDLIALLNKRVYDVAGCNPSIKVYLNGTELGIKSFEKYISLYFLADDSPPKIFYEKVSPRWEIAVTLSTEGQFNQVSFVNSICTAKGGTHVTHAISNVISAISEQVTKKNKGGIDMKPAFIKNHLSVFVNSLIENPHFDSQTKENLTSKVSSFGSKCEPSEKFIKKVVDTKSGIVPTIIEWAKYKEQSSIKKTTTGTKKGRVSHPKLEDANLAGSSKSQDCTLILTEGDSAMNIARNGFSVVGRDYYGAFPLKGKMVNVRESTYSDMITNDEIRNITTIVGLQHGKVYTELSTLRYGHIMIMTDQDHDGSHIKGLLINLIHHFWPTLLKMEGFLVEFITPIVKVFKNNVKPISFYTLPEYISWKEKNRGWRAKYYKGLGTSTDEEAAEYFQDLSKHKIDFEWDDEADNSIDLAFNKKRADDRKQWMSEHTTGSFLEQYGVERLSYSDFINKELILFSIADCERSIPSVVDGLKTSLRKIMFGCFKRNLVKEVKVAQLIGYISEHTAYHHGEQSLSQAIVGMAQNFVGSNNINLLFPAGNFGSRYNGGKDAASARYIHTRLADMAREIYNPLDDPTLHYTIDDGKKVQPKWYMPIIPMILVNGGQGIGTGWSSTIPSYNPRELIENMRRALKKQDLKTIKPWYRGFNGEIEQKSSNQYIVKGVWKKLGEHKLEVTELPIKTWPQEFKEYLEKLMNVEEKEKKATKGAKTSKTAKTAKKLAKTTTTKTKKKKADDDDDEETSRKEPIIKSYDNHSVGDSIHFIIETVKPVDELNIEKIFKLASNISETNMVVFDEEGRIRKFETTMEIQEHFFTLRMKTYSHRKEFLVEKLNQEYLRLTNKARFILAVVNKELVISNVKKVDIMKKLKAMKFDKIYTKNVDKIVKSKLRKSKIEEEDAAISESEEEQDKENEDKNEVEDVDNDNNDDDSKGYDYLLSLPLWSLTLERVNKIQQEREKKKQELDDLIATTLETLYGNDLDALELSLDKMDADRAKMAKTKSSRTAKTKTLPKARKISAKAAAKTKPSALTEIAKPTTASIAAITAKPAATKRKKSEPEPESSKNQISSYFSKVTKPSPPTVNLDDSIDFGDTAELKQSNEVFEIDSDVEEPPKKTKKAATTTGLSRLKKAAPAPTKKAAKKDDSFIDDEESSEEEDDAPSIISKRPVRRVGKIAPPPMYDEDSDIFDSEVSGSDYESD
eukprot:gene7836-9650_t